MSPSMSARQASTPNPCGPPARHDPMSRSVSAPAHHMNCLASEDPAPFQTPASGPIAAVARSEVEPNYLPRNSCAIVPPMAPPTNPHTKPKRIPIPA